MVGRNMLTETFIRRLKCFGQREIGRLVNASDEGRIASMTGYAAREGGAEGLHWTWEMRGVNARGLDLRLRLPDGLGALEAPLRKRLSAGLARGAVTVNLRLTSETAGAAARIDPDGLASALQGLARVAQAASEAGLALAPPSAAEVLSLRGVADSAPGPALPDADTLLAEADALLAAFRQMRDAEGAALHAVLSGQIDQIAALCDAAEAAAAVRTETQAEAFRAAVAKLVATTDLDPARLAQEVAHLAVKSDVTEEIDRLRAHVAAARDLLAAGGPVGRKLDFLMQEFNREANTLCSKSGDADLTAIGLDLKLAIDQTREQVQNVE